MATLNKQLKYVIFCLCFLSVSGCTINGQSNEQAATWYKVKKLAEKTWCISDNGIVNIYLIEGNKQAILIDNGYGFANIRDLVKSITKLPLTVVITHGHRDHCGAVYQFPLVYAHPLEFNSIMFNNTKTTRKTNSEIILKGKKIPDNEIFKDTLHLKPTKLKPVKDSYIFDLGGRKIEVIEVPGHTPGSIVLLDASNKMLFSGDHINALVWLFLKGCLPLETYLKSLEKIKLRAKEFNIIYPGHNEPLDSAFLNELITCCKSILDGTCKGEKYTSSAGDAMLCIFKRSSIAFDPDNLFTDILKKNASKGLDWSPKVKIETNGELITPGDSVLVRITSSNKTIRYTLDGSEPTVNSSLYEKILVIKKPLTLKAIPFDIHGIQGDQDSIVFNYNSSKQCKPAPAGTTVQSVFDKYIEAIGGTKNLSKIKDLTIKTDVEVQGTKLNACITCKIPDKSLTEVSNSDGNPVQKTTINGEAGKKLNGDLQGEELNKAKIESNIFFPQFNYEKMGYRPELKGITEIDGKAVYLIVLYSSWNSLISEYYSVKSGLKIKLETTRETPNGKINETSEMLEYIDSNGVKFPKIVKIKQSAYSQLIEVCINSIEVNTGVKDDIFN